MCSSLYISPLFRKAWTYAKTPTADRIYILSAKYRLLCPDDKITFYNETLLKKPVAECKKWANDDIGTNYCAHCKRWIMQKRVMW